MLVYQRVDEQFATQARHNVGFAPQWHLFGQSFRGTQWSGGCTVVVFVRVLVSWVVFMRLLQHLPRALVRPIDGKQLKSMQQKVDSQLEKIMDVSNMPKKKDEQIAKMQKSLKPVIPVICLYIHIYIFLLNMPFSKGIQKNTSSFQPCWQGWSYLRLVGGTFLGIHLPEPHDGEPVHSMDFGPINPQQPR